MNYLVVAKAEQIPYMREIVKTVKLEVLKSSFQSLSVTIFKKEIWVILKVKMLMKLVAGRLR